MDCTYSRRSFLARTSTIAGTLGLAGCFGAGPLSKFRLTSFELPDITSEFVENPIESKSKYELDYSDAYKQAKVDELVETGTVSTRGWELSYRNTWGDDWRHHRHVLLRDGTYYRIYVEDVTYVERERWQFTLGWYDQDPSESDTVVSRPVSSLSDRDQKIVAAAADGIPADGRRGPVKNERNEVTYHAELDADESDLVPNPPFDYLDYEGEYFRAAAEQRPITHKEQTFSVEAVADSQSEYEQYAHDEFPDARFADVSLSSSAEDVMEVVTSVHEGYAYEEEPPLSEGLEEVLEHLTIADDLKPHDSYDDTTWFYGALAEYDGQWYDFDLVIYP